jgi:GNAT superfamily N-acetyltransferase
MTEPLTFEPLDGYPHGILEQMQIESYAGLHVSDAVRAEIEHHWRKVDDLAFDNFDTVGRNMFITCLAGKPIGLGAYDPRRGPEIGVIGQNCILPPYRNKGYGQRQILEILRRMRERQIRKAVVSTGEDDFFAPARRMYLACGFHETRRFTIYDGEFHCIEYQLDLA